MKSQALRDVEVGVRTASVQTDGLRHGLRSLLLGPYRLKVCDEPADAVLLTCALRLGDNFEF